MKVFYIKINDSLDDVTGMDAISLVDFPAVKKNFLCFSEEKNAKKLQFADHEKHIITGVVCLADTPIYRWNEQIGDYYVVFSKETIRQLIEKYSKQGLWNSVNLQHNDDEFINSAVMVETYLIDKERGIVPNEFADVPDGSWIASFKITDDKMWNYIVNGDDLKGFSLQGLFDIVPEEQINEKLKAVNQDEFPEDPFDVWVNQYLDK